MFFFFNDTATTEIYTLSLHDALPISSAVRVRVHHVTRIAQLSAPRVREPARAFSAQEHVLRLHHLAGDGNRVRSEEHTSELQSRQYLVCRLLLEKKKSIHTTYYITYN